MIRFLTGVVFAAMLAGCTYTIKIKDGPTAYDRKQYATSIPMLEKDLQRAKTRTEKGKIAYMLGDACRRTGQDAAALDWFNQAYANNFGPEALKAAAYQMKKMERYAEAKEAFRNLGIEIGSPYEYRKELTTCDVAADWKKQAANNGWSLEQVPFNSPYNDFSPVRFEDGRLVFSSDRGNSSGDAPYNWTGNKFMDLFIADPGGASPQSFDPSLNTGSNEGSICFNGEFTELFFVRSVSAYKGDDAYCKIYQSVRDVDTWSPPRPLPFIKEKINYLHPYLAPDGLTLYFACNDPEGWGGYDLYRVKRNLRAESGWDEPQLLSRNINTPGNELFPTLDADTLYFASDGLPGMGGLDVFRTYQMERSSWAPPMNLKAPVNSGGDDFGLIITERHPGTKPGDLLLAGYLTSNRPDGRGGDDIYRLEQRIPPPAPPKVDTTPTQPLVYKILLEVYVLEKIFAVPDDPNSSVIGRRPLDKARVQMQFNGKQETLSPGDDGFMSLELEQATDYSFSASREGFLSNTARFSTRGMAKDPATPVQVYELEIVLDKIYRNKEIVLENIYYDYDKWDIRPDAEPTLNRLAEVLHQNPDIRIQLGSHTDCRGNDAYNENLSQKRAESAVRYLIGRGIAPERLSAAGYGESQPAVDCACSRCTEAEHQANRRTTFKVLE